MASGAWCVRDAVTADEDSIVQFQCDLAMETEHRALTESVVRRGVSAVVGGRVDSARYFVVCEKGEGEAVGAAVGSLMITKEWSDWRDGYFMWIQVERKRQNA